LKVCICTHQPDTHFSRLYIPISLLLDPLSLHPAVWGRAGQEGPPPPQTPPSQLLPGMLKRRHRRARRREKTDMKGKEEQRKAGDGP